MRLRKLTLPLVVLAVAAAAASALASTLTVIPIPTWATNSQSSGPDATNYTGILHQNEGRAITPDGKYVVGLCYDRTNLITAWSSDSHTTYLQNARDQARGYFFNVTANTIGQQPSTAGSIWLAVTGVGYRTNNLGTIEAVCNGWGGGGPYPCWNMTTDGGTNLNVGIKCRDATVDFTKSGGPVIPLANTLAATTNSDAYYSIAWGFQPFENSLKFCYTYRGSNSFGNAHLTIKNYFQCYDGDGQNGHPVQTGNYVRINGIAATGRSVGQYVDGGADWGGAPYEGFFGTAGGILNFVLEYPPTIMPGAGAPPYQSYQNIWVFPGLDGTWTGSAWAITPDGNTIFGHSPTYATGPWYGYKAIVGAVTNTFESIARLPDFVDAAPKPGATWAVTPFGCSTDGRYAVGTCYRGATLGERAVLWDTGDADTNNWTALDLTDYATSEGIMGSFTKLERAYSVGVNADGYPVVTGYGKYTDGAETRNRAFVLVVTPAVAPAVRPQITSITPVGAGNLAINYTNTVIGKTYLLEYNTNLNNLADWYSAGSKEASGTSDSQTESSVTSAVRFYRVSYTP